MLQKIVGVDVIRGRSIPSTHSCFVVPQIIARNLITTQTALKTEITLNKQNKHTYSFFWKQNVTLI